MLISTRDLSIDDLNSIMEIVNHKNKITGIDIKKYNLDYFSKEISRFLEPYPNKDLGRVIGYFENNELISFLTQQFTERGPMWYMTMLGTKSSHRWNYKLNGLEHCWSYAMTRAENAGIYKIVYALPAAWGRTQRKTLKTSDVWQKYDLYYECIIPAGSMPVWPEHKNVFGTITKEHDVLIKTAILKNEYRPADIRSQM